MGVEQLRRLVEIQQRIVELSKQLPVPHPGASRHYSISQPVFAHPFSTPPLSVRRTSAPAACSADPRARWMDTRLRSQSLSSTGSSNSSSPGVDIRLDRPAVGSEFVDPAFAAVVESFFLPVPAFDRAIPVDVRQSPTVAHRLWARMLQTVFKVQPRFSAILDFIGFIVGFWTSITTCCQINIELKNLRERCNCFHNSLLTAA